MRSVYVLLARLDREDGPIYRADTFTNAREAIRFARHRNGSRAQGWTVKLYSMPRATFDSRGWDRTTFLNHPETAEVKF